MSRLLDRWRGVVISLLGVAAILWLAVDGSLGLYIHPRYFVFTVVMAVIAGVAVIAAFALVPARGDADDEHGHDHEHDHGTGGRSPVRRGLTAAGTLVAVAVAAVVLVVFPPSTLSTTSASTAQLDNATTVSAPSTELLTGTDTATFSVKDWASVLRQGGDFADGRTADLTGFVMASPDSPDLLYVARYVITCCAVDAQPAGVPVYSPGWQDSVQEGAWVHVTGAFSPNPVSASTAAYTLTPTVLEPIDEPSDPYDY
ncbi:TIGR03943 family protein [Cnuibacter physcomitrellae]|uniref:TIGR03943 family putative permease subunit n=1 Tax=Cnuibacter physcomitrellae TaxID=1619308 RepID=UPI0021759A37|nr:TIGR03943 family protein [Cnuibacter physcomitrellae]MCS5498615.1 TIGR03943 family protein [Cnuibacter physcomitrellae]